METLEQVLRQSIGQNLHIDLNFQYIDILDNANNVKDLLLFISPSFH